MELAKSAPHEEARAARNHAPVALFVHARPDHTSRTIAALAANHGAQVTDLHVFADGPRSDREIVAVEQVRKIVAESVGFRSVRLFAREVNVGLANNITQGVTQLVEQHGRVIVLEDDIVTSCDFLEFMNQSLDRYAEVKSVWHINGWTYPVRTQTENRAFFTPIMECWGWATWRDRWERYERRTDRFLGAWRRTAIRRFNIGGGYDYWGDLKRNAAGSLRTWAVFWYAIMFEHGGLCLSPPQSYTVNIGIDGSGANSGTRDIYAAPVAEKSPLPLWPEVVAEDTRAWMMIRDFMLSKRPWIGRRLASKVKWGLKGLLARWRAIPR